VTVSPGALVTPYATDKPSGGTPVSSENSKPTVTAEIRVRHIVVKTKEEAEEILARLKKGEDFTKVALEKSLCPSKAQGGDLGLFSRGSNLVKEFEDASFLLEVGEISKPVQTKFGWHIIQRIEPDMKIERETVRVCHIQVPTEKEAEEILGRLKKGEDFIKLALEKSYCNSRKEGGVIKPFSRGIMGLQLKEFEDAAFALKVGEISKPVKTRFGWHIIKRIDMEMKIIMPELKKIKASHILVDTKEEADELYKLVKEKKSDFAKLAKENSKCPSKNQGGDLGEFTQGDMVREFEDAAFSLKVGEISKPVKTQFGWHIIERTE